MEKRTPYERSLTSFSLRDEVLKLRLIVQESKAPIYPSYIMEKLNRLVNGIPIALDLVKQREFDRMMGEG